MNKKHDEFLNNLDKITEKVKDGWHLRGSLLIKFSKDQITTFNYMENRYNYIILNDVMKLSLLELCDTWYEELMDSYMDDFKEEDDE